MANLIEEAIWPATTATAQLVRAGHGERGGGGCNGPPIGDGDGTFTSDGFGNGTAGPFLTYLRRSVLGAHARQTAPLTRVEHSA